MMCGRSKNVGGCHDRMGFYSTFTTSSGLTTTADTIDAPAAAAARCQRVMFSS